MNSTLHTALVMLVHGYLEVCCVNPEAPVMKRTWLIRRFVDHRYIAF